MDVSKLELSNKTQGNLSGKSILSSNADVINNINVKLNVVLGEKELSVSELMSLQKGSVFTIDKKVNQPLEVYIDDKLVARGIMVAVEDDFGVKITEII